MTEYLRMSGAFVNYPRFNSDGSMTSTDCMPSGYLDLGRHYFAPAAGCPGGLSAAQVYSVLYQSTIACCPEWVFHT